MKSRAFRVFYWWNCSTFSDIDLDEHNWKDISINNDELENLVKLAYETEILSKERTKEIIEDIVEFTKKESKK